MVIILIVIRPQQASVGCDLPSVQLKVCRHKQRRRHRQTLGRKNWWEIFTLFKKIIYLKSLYTFHLWRWFHPRPCGAWVGRLRRCRLEDSFLTYQAGQIFHLLDLLWFVDWPWPAPGVRCWVPKWYRGDQADGFGLWCRSQVIKIHSEQGQPNPSLSIWGKLTRIFTPLQELFLVWNGCCLGARDLPECLIFGLSLICSKNNLLQSYFSLLVAILIHFVRVTVDHWVTTGVCVSKLKLDALEKILCNFTLHNEGNFTKIQEAPLRTGSLISKVATVW